MSTEVSMLTSSGADVKAGYLFTQISKKKTINQQNLKKGNIFIFPKETYDLSFYNEPNCLAHTLNTLQTWQNLNETNWNGLGVSLTSPLWFVWNKSSICQERCENITALHGPFTHCWYPTLSSSRSQSWSHPLWTTSTLCPLSLDWHHTVKLISIDHSFSAGRLKSANSAT